MGLVYLNAGNLSEAQHWMETSLPQFGSVQLTRPHRTVALHGLSLLYLYQGRYADSLDHAMSALDSAKQRSDHRHIAIAKTYMGNACLGQGNTVQARKCYLEAVATFKRTAQYNRIMEPLAGLANIALQLGDLDEAKVLVDRIANHITVNELDNTEEAAKVYLICYRVLVRTNDPRSELIRSLALRKLKRRAGSLADQTARQMFWVIPDHQEIVGSVQQTLRS